MTMMVVRLVLGTLLIYAATIGRQRWALFLVLFLILLAHEVIAHRLEER